MPLYEFVCQKCELEQELLVRGNETPKCEGCGGIRLTKLLSVPAAHSSTGGPSAPRPASCGSCCDCFPE